ncbi:hypothetical protein [Methylobacterium ajmalii]|uniref:GT-D fold domain-containing protein n=1 Tax=Methylobacterium ajmalii TaxID=2738439 RepID=UPI0039C8AEEF
MDISEVAQRIESHDYDRVAHPDQIAPLQGQDFDRCLAIAVQMKVSGRKDWAVRFLQRVIDVFPKEPSARYELAFLLQESKDLLGAVIQAEIARTLSPDSFRLGVHYGHLLAANGAHEEASRVLDTVKFNSEAELAELRSIMDFNRYLQETPRSKAIYITRKLRDKYYWMHSREVAGAIEKAIQETRPFSLIRLGDGDGAHFSVNQRDEERYPHLHARVRKQHTEFLLGRDNDPEFTGYTAVTKTLARHVKEADILGISYSSWIEHEYDISSPVTITCLMNTNRHFYENERVPGLTLCDQLIHAQLHQDRLMDPIMRQIKSMTVISCLDGLPARINELFGISDIELIKIPSETYAPHLYGEKHLAISKHFPHAFWPTIQQLSVPHNGRVFLIAAGTFGKYYATIIKRHGGIALDLGSLVDGWMKLASRPGYAEAFA